MSRYVRANHVNFMSVADIDGKKRAWGKIRYNHKGAWCTVDDGEYVLGGGTIL